MERESNYGYGNPQTAQSSNHPAITYVYDPIGRMTSLTDQIGSQTIFTYDKRNLLTGKTDPLNRLTGFTYYNDGNLWTKTDRNGATITYSYTPSGKLNTIAYPNGTTGFTYNLLDQLVVMQDSIGITSYGYDAAGRLSATSNPFGFAIGYTYDAAGNLSELTYPGNKKVIYSYDALNRVKTVTIDWLPGKPSATYNYDDAGRLSGLTTFNGIATTYGYDAANRLTSSTSPVASYSFIPDGNGNRTNETRTEPLALANNPAMTAYSYNATGNRLISAGTASFGYDNEGQLASGYGSGFSFDYEHRLTSVGGATYNYDGAGNRLQTISGGIATRYIYDAGGNLLAEADGSNTITRYYIHGAGLMAMVTPSEQVYSYHYNATGSTVAMTDQSQAMVNKYAYDPFGNIGNQQETIPQPFKYVGKFGVMSEPNGFYYMKARYYDPQVGRFISEDPIGFGGGDVNLMAYVGGNPINLIDPTGLDGVQAISAITTLVGTIKSITNPQSKAGELVGGLAVDSAAHMFNIAPNQSLSDLGGLTASAIGAGMALASGGAGAVGIASFGLGLSIGNLINHATMPFTGGMTVQQSITESVINGNNPFKTGCGR